MDLLLEEIYQLMADDLQEGVRKRVFRKGKLKKKLFCPKGLKAKGLRCVPIKGKEKMTRKIKNKKGAVKRKAKMGKILRKRKRSMRKRKALGM
jgi:hypothetical protein